MELILFWDLEPDLKINFNKKNSAVSLEDARMKKRSFLPVPLLV